MSKAATDVSPLIESFDQHEVWQVLGIKDRATFVREAVACSHDRYEGWDDPRIELGAWVGVPRQRCHWGVQEMELGIDTPTKDVIAAIREMLELAESLRGKHKGF